VMVVHPDSMTAPPDLSDEQDETTAVEPGDPDSMPGLSDLSEDQDQSSVAEPHPRSIRKSSKMMDRPFNSDAEQRSEAKQTPSESANAKEQGPAQAADNEKIAGRSNGMQAEREHGQQDVLQLTTAQRSDIWKRLGNQPAANAPSGFQPKVGAIVPPSVQLSSLPSSVSSQMPQLQPYNYAMVQSQLLIVDPASKKIVSIITE
jgi:hypothetical protein